ncbi:MAG: mannosyl-3-phosphoglycerate synthase [Nitrosopumilus sp.]|nr:mannosyl-3-phosphoglycerate synthase [Nitrosopumilus sp.]
MRLDFPPKYTERIGAVSIHELQKIYEIDSGKLPKVTAGQQHQTIRAFSYDELSSVYRELAIVIPVKNEKLSLLEGVLSGIPNECLIIIVSNSQRTPIDRFSMEVEMIKQYSRFAEKKIVIIHQGDTDLAKIFRRVNYTSILDFKSQVRDGKAEGMIIGILLAKMFQKKYVGFIDSDNYFPGAVNEYVKIFAAGFGMSTTLYSNIRVSWRSKPKIVNNALHFPKWGRISEFSNKYLNDIISNITGFEREIITTANSGEHALSMPLAENLNYSSGYSIEPYELINILEKFGGLLSSEYSEIIDKGIEIFQIETRNPHFHEEKGNEHLTGMLEESLLAINNSKICNTDITRDIKNQLLILQVKHTNTINKINQQKKHIIMDPIKLISIDKFADLVLHNSKTFKKI